MIILLWLITIYFLIILNGFFVAAEFALVKVRASQLDLKAQKGSSRAKLAKTLIEKFEFLEHLKIDKLSYSTDLIKNYKKEAFGDNIWI